MDFVLKILPTCLLPVSICISDETSFVVNLNAKALAKILKIKLLETANLMLHDMMILCFQLGVYYKAEYKTHLL